MTLKVFTFPIFQFFLHVASGYLVGPSDVTGVVGSSVNISCYYSAISANIHGRKFWCKVSKGECNTIISTTGFIAKSHYNRTDLELSTGSFMMQMTKLQHEDAGLYRCGIGQNNNLFYYPIHLTVSEAGNRIPTSSEFFLEKLMGSLTIHCPIRPETKTYLKYWCRMNRRRSDCVTVVNSNGFVHKDLWGRVLLKEEENGTRFVVMLNGLKTTDSGYYRCGTGSFLEGTDRKDVHIFISDEKAKSRIGKQLNGFLGESVLAQCTLPEQFNPSSLVYWCKWAETGCMRLVDSVGFVQDQMKDKIILEPYNYTQRSYHILMTQLQSEDSGFYWCAIIDGHREHTMSVELRIHVKTIDVHNRQNITGHHSTASYRDYSTDHTSEIKSTQDTTTDMSYSSTISREQHKTNSNPTYFTLLEQATVTKQDNTTDMWYPSSISRAIHETAPSSTYFTHFEQATVTEQGTTDMIHYNITSTEQHKSTSSPIYASTSHQSTVTDQDNTTDTSRASREQLEIAASSKSFTQDTVTKQGTTDVMYHNNTSRGQHKSTSSSTYVTTPLQDIITDQDNTADMWYPTRTSREQHETASIYTSFTQATVTKQSTADVMFDKSISRGQHKSISSPTYVTTPLQVIVADQGNTTHMWYHSRTSRAQHQAASSSTAFKLREQDTVTKQGWHRFTSRSSSSGTNSKVFRHSMVTRTYQRSTIPRTQTSSSQQDISVTTITNDISVNSNIASKSNSFIVMVSTLLVCCILLAILGFITCKLCKNRGKLVVSMK
uniref:Polymeric immunoglobulin receptor n=1 Tax=Leptobrachium leishanense TaxID=445787 RepID=A0A8C5PF71_9ANUR